MNLKNYKWGYLTAVTLFVLAPYWYWAGLHEPQPPLGESYAGFVISWFILFILAGIGVLFRNSFGWYVCYAVLGLIGGVTFVLGWVFPIDTPIAITPLSITMLIGGVVLLNMIPVQRWYWRREQSKDTGSLRRHLLYLNSSLLLLALIGYLLVLLFS
jgi:hypothetical protein